ncbi:transketolase [Streptomyces sp. SID13726]|uniref:transketolase n=1 Tax=Streptomyces sp. SID13726 TaxID=2706058 RepID=UPI0013B6367E|nr:transketolase [Streptomyces sp. SID13726]NEB03578.1 transketolase [Streptomyces sp. SID13726]
MQSDMLLAVAETLPRTPSDGGVVVGYGALEELSRFAADPRWTLHVPGHPDEVRQTILDAGHRGERAYVHVTAEANAEPRAAAEGFARVRDGRAGVVLAVGATLDPVLRATADLDLAVLYARTLRPFDEIGLRTAVLAADHADVVLAEPGPTGTTACHVAATLVHVPHRLLTLDGRNCFEEEGLERAVREFLR